jgi:hypothetical protein
MSTTVPESESKSLPIFTLNRFFLKAKYSFYSALLFFLFANPETSIVFQRFFGGVVTFVTHAGAPTIYAVFINTFLFFLTMLGLMLLPSE